MAKDNIVNFQIHAGHDDDKIAIVLNYLNFANTDYFTIIGFSSPISTNFQLGTMDKLDRVLKIMATWDESKLLPLLSQIQGTHLYRQWLSFMDEDKRDSITLLLRLRQT